MTALARRVAPITIAEFDAFLHGLGDDARDYELLDGEIVMMTNPNNRHDRIVFNIMARLSPAMLTRGCMLHAGSMRIQRNDDVADIVKPKPDLMVTCGRRDQLSNYVTDPIVVIEVLSPSTRRNDVTRKLPFYLSLASTRHVVIIHQDERRIEHWHRTDADVVAAAAVAAERRAARASEEDDLPDGWTAAILPRENRDLVLAAVGVSIAVDDIYQDVDFAGG